MKLIEDSTKYIKHAVTLMLILFNRQEELTQRKERCNSSLQNTILLLSLGLTTERVIPVGSFNSAVNSGD